MTLRPDITEFVADLEVFCKRKLNYPLEVGEILQLTVQTGLINEFEELIFQAKFLVRTQEVMNQFGREMAGFEKLSTEFRTSIGRLKDLLKKLIERAEGDALPKYSDIFFSMETESVARLMKFCSDLSWIKNWQIDGKPLPYENTSSKKYRTPDTPARQRGEPPKNNPSTKSLSRIQKAAVLAALLLVVFIFIDPPVTTIGWVLTLWIAVILAYIVLQIVLLTRNQNFH
jgi:hypothetical protein